VIEGSQSGERHPSETSKRRILLVDDDRDFALAHAKLLGLEGYEVAVARDEAEALEALRRSDPQVALLDVRLEKSSGLDLIAPMTDVRPGLITIMLSGYAGVDEAIASVRRGAYDFLRKPVHPEELLAALDRCFEKIRLEQDKEKAEKALRRSEARLARAQRIAGIGHWEWDLGEDRELFVSPESHDIWGSRRGALFAGPAEFLATVHPEDRHRVEEVLDEALQDGRDYETDYRILREDGEVRFVLEHGQFEPDLEGKPAHLVGTVQDITELKRVEQQLSQAQKSEMVGQLAGEIAHDFNNHLGVILGNLELLAEEVGGNESLRGHLHWAINATDSAATLTRRLLAFSRQQVLSPETTAVNQLVVRLIDLARPSLGETVAIETLLAPDLWPALVDPRQLEAALLNLLLNARWAMGQGGQVSIVTRNCTFADDEDDQESVPVGDHIMLSVTDTGAGMPPEVVEHVFDPFFTTKDAPQASGLGLSMVQGFVQQSGGHIKIHSEVGQGTTFRIYLPRGQEEAVDEERPPPEPGSASDGKTILVVEDDPNLRDLAVRAIKSLGYRVREAATAQAALEILAATEEIDLLFTDIMLPGGMSGAELANEARRLHGDLAILLTSGYTGGTLLRGEVGVPFDIVKKPYRRETLAARLRAALDQTESEKETVEAASPARLVVVDDDPGFAEFVRKVARKMGFEVEVAGTGEAFTRTFERFDPTAVVLDVVMPDVEGVELIRWLADRDASVHVIVVTGFTPHYADLAKKLGEAKGLQSVAALTKPVKVADLKAALERTTGG
jgi:PAS domain S-box-containing protein